MSSTIMDLPPELILSISSHLTTAKLGGLRGTCKHIEKILFDSFAKEFFTKRQFMIERDSLEALLGIANHPTLSRHLSEVLISTQHRRHNMDAENEDDGNVAGHSRAVELTREILLATGLARDLLKRAFSKLPNLRIVGVRDYDGGGRIRDGPRARWRSYGWATYPNVHIIIDAKASAVFALVVAALADGLARPPNLEVILRRTVGLRPNAFYTDSSAESMLAGLKSLMLDVDGGSVNNTDPERVKLHNQPIQQFLASATALEALRLNFRHDFLDTGKVALLEWLGQPVVSSPISPGVSPVSAASFARLKKLEIGMALVPASTLLAVLTKFDLSSFSLWKVHLQCLAPDNRSDADGWLAFLRNLAAELQSSSIKSATIGHVAQLSYSGMTRAMYFYPEGVDTDEHPKFPTYKLLKEVNFRARYGSNVSQWLEDITDRAWDWSNFCPLHAVASSDDEMDSDVVSDDSLQHDEDSDNGDEV